MRQNWYFRLLISYFPIFLLTVSILIFLSFIMVSEISRSETEKADRISTSYTADNVQQAVHEAELSVLNEATTNGDFDRYLDMRNTMGSDSLVEYNVVEAMRTVEKNDPIIYSMYLYRNSDSSVLTTSGNDALNSFYDRDFIRKALAKREYQGWSAVREIPADGADPAVKVISMYKQTPLPFGKEGLLVINVSVYEISKIIDQTINHQVSFMRVYDKDGRQVYPLAPDDDDASGKVLNTVQTGVLGWKFESGIKAGQLFAWVSVISYVWVLIAVLTVAFAIFYIIYVTRKNYKPIQHMMQRIQAVQIRGVGGSVQRDELSLIDNALASLIDQATEFEKEHRENLLVQRRQLFLDLLGGEWSGDMQKRLAKLSPLPELPGEEEQYIVVVAEINRYDEFQGYYTPGDQGVLKFALMNVLQELARNENLNGWAEWISGSRSGIILKATGDEKEIKERLLAAVDNSRRWVAEHLRISLSLGIGASVGKPSGINHSYKTAISALEHKLSLGKDAVIMSDDLPEDTGPEMFKYLQIVADCVQEFRMTGDGWRGRLDQMFTMLEADALRDEDIRSLLQALVQMLGRELKGLSDGLREHFAGEHAAKWRRSLKEASTLRDMHTVLLDYLTDIYRTYVAVCETKSHRAMISEMRSYIIENFANPDLSLKHLSDRFQISGKYASHLFKVEFDMKFVDFLVQLRMQHAEQLLAETEDSIQDIALQVGYANSITFGRVFKRVTGVTPGDFRKLRMKPSVSMPIAPE